MWVWRSGIVRGRACVFETLRIRRFVVVVSKDSVGLGPHLENIFFGSFTIVLALDGKRKFHCRRWEEDQISIQISLAMMVQDTK